LRLERQIAGFNGGVYVLPDMSVVTTHLLAPEAAREALRLILEAELEPWIYTVEDWSVRDKYGPHVAHESQVVALDPKIARRFPDEVLASAVKIVGVSDDETSILRCEGKLKALLGANASVSRSQSYYVDVTHPLANKGEVATAFAKLLEIDASEIATIGDGANDVLMFERSGFSVAMGNAGDEVRAKASAVTASNAEEGFAKAMRELILPRA
jgi:Cof subfamily protein (haloacid dehalogenase superfamily)